MNKKVNLSTVFLAIAIILIIVIGISMYMQKTEADRYVAKLENQIIEFQETINKLQKQNTLENVKLGEYNLNEVDYSDPTLPNNEGCGVTLKENNECYIYEGWGSGRIGVYHIEDDKIICNTVMRISESGGLFYDVNNIIFTFEVVDNNTLRLIDIENNAENVTNKDSHMNNDGDVIYDPYGLSKGMTYSIK